MSNIATEDQEQEALFQWAEFAACAMPELRLMYAIPNGGYRAPRTAALLKRTGVKPGVPDICLPVPRPPHPSLYIELKRVKGGVVSAYQKCWHYDLKAQGHKVVVAYGWEQAREAIMEYMGV